MESRKIAIIVALAMCLTTTANVHADPESDALIQAAKSNNTAEVARLLADGADVDTADGYGISALMHTAMNDALDAAELLIEAGADVSATDRYGVTALVYAAVYNSQDVERVLKAAGAKE